MKTHRLCSSLLCFLFFTLAGTSISAQEIITHFSGLLTNAQTFTRPQAIIGEADADEAFFTRQLAPTDLEAGNSNYNYFVQAIVPQVSGLYTIAVSSASLTMNSGDPDTDTFLFLYADEFTPTAPLGSLVAANDDSYNNVGNYTYFSQLTNVSLTAGTTYYIVVTSYNIGSTGTIDFSASGPGTVELSTLPVRWLRFTASKQGNIVELAWSTATEENTKDYVVQRSADGRTWNNLGTVAAAGYSSVVQQYSLVDRQPLSDANYYRILQRDLNGREVFSKAVMVNLSNPQTLLRLYPNPVVNGQLTVKLEKNARVELYNAVGVLVLQKQLTAGNHQLLLSHLPKGVYTIKAAEATQVLVLQ